MRIAVIDKCPSKVNYEKYFDFEFDHYHLSSVYLQKILKKDVDININTTDYDFIKYKGKVNYSVSQFDKNKHKFVYDKLARKYSDDDLLKFFLANFF